MKPFSPKLNLRAPIRALLLAAACALLLPPTSLAQIPKPMSPKYEAWLTKEVRHELLMLPWYSVFDSLEYKVDGTEVTLTGAVVHATLKSDAENAVKRLEGVTKVNNNIEILPPSPMDDRIRRAEYRSIYGEPSLSRYAWGSVQAIHIIVKGGHVTLEGVVANQADKNIAGIRAKSVPDTFSVDNNLRVESGSK
jgi:hyperosmotically inducible periplasmic protein